MTDKGVVKQLEELLEPIKKDLSGVKRDLGEINKKLEQHDKNFAELRETLDEHGRKLDQHTGALVNIEDTIKIYGDMYQVNNDNARKLEKRIDGGNCSLLLHFCPLF
jgi:septal ring factor EnvC (AmiA/AmiB activator)